MNAYDQARKDHEYLWDIGPAKDMTGGYVDQEDLQKLLKSPSKSTAAKCYTNQIIYWFEVGPEGEGIDYSDERIVEIAYRYGARHDRA